MFVSKPNSNSNIGLTRQEMFSPFSVSTQAPQTKPPLVSRAREASRTGLLAPRGQPSQRAHQEQTLAPRVCSQLARGPGSARRSCLPAWKQAHATQSSAALRQTLMLWGFAFPASSLGKKQRGDAASGHRLGRTAVLLPGNSSLKQGKQDCSAGHRLRCSTGSEGLGTGQ